MKTFSVNNDRWHWNEQITVPKTLSFDWQYEINEDGDNAILMIYDNGELIKQTILTETELSLYRNNIDLFEDWIESSTYGE